MDVELRRGMWDYLREVNAQGTTILLTTHYLEEVEQMCRNAAIIKEGSIVRNDTVRNLIAFMPQDTYCITVKDMRTLWPLQDYKPVSMDGHVIEIEIQQREQLNDVLMKMVQSGFIITDVHPKGNRLEKLFLQILKT